VRDKFRDYTELLVLDRHGHLVATSSDDRQVTLPRVGGRSAAAGGRKAPMLGLPRRRAILVADRSIRGGTREPLRLVQAPPWCIRGASIWTVADMLRQRAG
jgi:hypothetical protein